MINGENLKPPLCKICNAAHWSWQDHKFEVEPRIGKFELERPKRESEVMLDACAPERRNIMQPHCIEGARRKRSPGAGRPPKFEKPMTATERSRRFRALKAELQAQGLAK
jgi:hypothetical protein